MANFCKFTYKIQLLSFGLYWFMCQFLSWEKIWEDWSENLKHKIRSLDPASAWSSSDTDTVGVTEKQDELDMAVFETIRIIFKLIISSFNVWFSPF